MEGETSAASSEAAEVTVVSVPDDAAKSFSVSDAARMLRASRKPKEAAASAEDAAEQPQELADEADAGSPEEIPSDETVEGEDAVEDALPPVEPPRSWSKEDKETFATLPRETQERIAERERSREVDFLRRQNEAAEMQKALQAQVQAASQTRLQYENALPVLLQTLQSQQAGEFSDIQTMQDVENMARNDPLRYNVWDAQQKKISAVQQEMQATQVRQYQEQMAQWQHFAQQQDALFAQSAPEVNDPVKGPQLREAAVNVLRELGFSQEELAQQWNLGFLRDHRVQRLLLDAVKYREARTRLKAPPKPVAPVVNRPGVAKGRDTAKEAHIQSLEDKLNHSTGHAAARAAAQLMAARRSGRR